ncbi:MAG TPA: hypothetical protein VEZ90_18115, partial [Blastocatellia bacterium]|nr:hypothetical protein [Blastocatellia bacterium]
MTLITEETKVFIDHNVYILGAGFSADANVPMVKDFLHKMRASLNWLKAQGNREREVNAIREVLEFRKVAASAAFRVNLNIENIEDLFSLAAASGRYPLAQSVSAAIAGTIDYARRTGDILSFDTYVGGSFQKPPSWMATNEESDAARYLIPAYDLYAGLLSGRACSPGRFMRNTIITFNYDTVLEESLVTWKTPFSYGFRPRSVEYDHSSKSVPDNQTDTLRVLKLHGSVNWANQG